MSDAKKNDTEKPPMELLPTKALEEIAKAFGYGAKKYSKFNWTNGFEWGRLIGASYRHLNAFNSGEDIDDESKLLHLSHLGACVMMLIEHQVRALGTDNRHKWNKDYYIKMTDCHGNVIFEEGKIGEDKK